MYLPEVGISKDEILARLEVFRERDLPWRSGRVLAYTYDPGAEAEQTSKAAYLSYLSENGLDPTSFPSLVEIERNVVRTVINLLQGDSEVVGNFTSGGTESLLLAVKTARDYARATRPEITQPEMIVPITAHSAFHKAAQYFDVKAVIVDVDPVTFKADVAATRAAITPNTILLVGSAPGYGHGVVDPIPELGQLALEHDLLLHVDGCVGGFHFAIMRRMGIYQGPAYDFSVPGVSSISTDLHKYGYALKGASTIMYRNKALRKFQIFSCARATTYALVNATVLSTKSGGPVAAAYATLHFLGESGYQRIVEPVMEATRQLVDGVNAIPGLRVLGTPDMCMFSFTADDFNIFQLSDAVTKRGWYIQPQFSAGVSPANMHITVNQNTIGVVDEFLAVLRDAAEEVRNHPAPIDLAAVRAGVNAMLETLGENPVEQLRAFAGLEGNGLPTEWAMLNSVLDSLPVDITEALLTEFMNDLYV